MNEDKASRYHRLKRRAAVASLALAGAVLAALLATGASASLREASAALAGRGPDAPATIAVYVLFLGIAQAAIALPLAVYEGYALEQRYGLSAESFRDWVRDYAKATAVGVVLTLAAAEIVYAAIRMWPRAWWLASAAMLLAGIAVLAQLAPVVLLPIFYKFKPLESEALRARLTSLSERAGVRVMGVYEWGLGDKTRRANAALVGTGRTRRVLVSDTLLAEYSEDEIEVILAHELGHHAHHDILKGLVLEGILIVAALAVAALALAALWQPLGLRGPSDVAGLPLVVLAAGAVMVALTPLVNAVSRRNERRADRYALALTSRPAAFVSAMRRLAAQNLAEASPSRAVVWLFHTHPPIEQRIAAARETNP